MEFLEILNLQENYITQLPEFLLNLGSLDEFKIRGNLLNHPLDFDNVEFYLETLAATFHSFPLFIKFCLSDKYEEVHEGPTYPFH